jgi:glycogen phosphorylase
MFESKEEFKKEYLKTLKTNQGVDIKETTSIQRYNALCEVMMEMISDLWIRSNKSYIERDDKQVFYFSLEFLLGKQLKKNINYMNGMDMIRESLKELEIDLDELMKEEPDAGLGNGGLGRLAACFMDSMASSSIPGHGNGIRYKYGLFNQKIIDGYQVELPDYWLKNGNMWEIRKEHKSVEVRYGGRIDTELAGKDLKFIHRDYEAIKAVPYDTPVMGYRNNTVNTLRLWCAETYSYEFDFSSFNRGDYLKAVEYKYRVESISQVLYPDDAHREGQMLRLKQQYFFVSAGVQSIVRHFKKVHGTVKNMDEKIAIHINDTHPALCIPELMRVLIDEEGLGWNEAWRITTNVISYTNHTILPEALEKWPVSFIKELLPRIAMIIEEINERFCREVHRMYDDLDKVAKMAVISNGTVYMAHLAIVGSHSVNGVAKIHTEILKKQVMSNFYEYYPTKFSNKTNGITHRRWLLASNPRLSSAISEAIGNSWIEHPTDLIKLMPFANDKSFKDKFREAKLENKRLLARYIREKNGIAVDPSSIFDVQVKRIHGYKRQFLNVLHILDYYNMLIENPGRDVHPRTFIFGGKAAPGYYQAKRIIKLINALAAKVNDDPRTSDKLKVVFLENYGVSLAQNIFPAADVSEQISTASKEASGTGNMKFMMNGAITIGTLDGANVEIREEVGDANFFLFGLTADQVISYHKHGGYKSWDIYNSNMRIKTVMDQLINGYLGVNEEEFRNLYDSILYNNDEYFILKDFDSYTNAHYRLGERFKDADRWASMGIANVAHSGKFSSDKTVMEYSSGIWGTKPSVII